jgi:hypothetical protein
VNLSNPKISGAKSLQTLIGDINRKDPAEYPVVGTIEVPDWRGVNNHFQGIAPLNGVVKITGQISASADDWWVASFVEEGNPATVTAVWGTQTYDHAGGIQRLGDLLPIGLENDDGLATVAFYDVTNPRTTPTRPLYEVHVAGKASAVAITNYTGSDHVEYAMLLVYQYKPKKFQVYRARVSDIGGTTNNWNYMGETNDIPDQDDDDQYQCFALATQTDGSTDSVFLVGFRENEAVGLYTVSTGSTDYGHLGYVTVYNGWEGSQWRYGVGLQICGPQHIRIFGCSEDPSGDRNDYHFPIYYWG